MADSCGAGQTSCAGMHCAFAHKHCRHQPAETTPPPSLMQQRTRITTEDELVVMSTRYRSQSQNIADALLRIEEMCTAAAEEPKEMSEEAKIRVAQLCGAGNLCRSYWARPCFSNRLRWAGSLQGTAGRRPPHRGEAAAGPAQVAAA